MTEFRKFAWFQLAVTGLAGTAVLVVYAITGNGMASLSGFSVMALLGFRWLTLSRNRELPIQDERDEAIHRRASTIGFAALWFFLVAWGVGVPLAFSDEGLVPLVYVASMVWVAWWLMISVQSVTILVLDSRGF